MSYGNKEDIDVKLGKFQMTRRVSVHSFRNIKRSSRDTNKNLQSSGSLCIVQRVWLWIMFMDDGGENKILKDGPKKWHSEDQLKDALQLI